MKRFGLTCKITAFCVLSASLILTGCKKEEDSVAKAVLASAGTLSYAGENAPAQIITVYSDATKTYMQLPVTIANNDSMPSVYLVKNGQENLVNYRIIGNIYQIDNVLSSSNEYFLMKSGQDEQVRIYRNI